MILLDTGPLVALCNRRDRLNQTALNDLKRVARDPLILCTPIMTEACFLLRGSLLRNRLQSTLNQLAIRVYVDDDEGGLWRDVFQWLARYQDHAADWADGYLAVVSGKNTRFRVWTYDRQFRTTWRRPDGTVIPLAVPAR